jgi:hypothetical protein
MVRLEPQAPDEYTRRLLTGCTFAAAPFTGACFWNVFNYHVRPLASTPFRVTPRPLPIPVRTCPATRANPEVVGSKRPPRPSQSPFERHGGFGFRCSGLGVSHARRGCIFALSSDAQRHSEGREEGGGEDGMISGSGGRYDSRGFSLGTDRGDRPDRGDTPALGAERGDERSRSASSTAPCHAFVDTRSDLISPDDAASATNSTKDFLACVAGSAFQLRGRVREGLNSRAKVERFCEAALPEQSVANLLGKTHASSSTRRHAVALCTLGVLCGAGKTTVGADEPMAANGVDTIANFAGEHAVCPLAALWWR